MFVDFTDASMPFCHSLPGASSPVVYRVYLPKAGADEHQPSVPAIDAWLATLVRVMGVTRLIVVASDEDIVSAYDYDFDRYVKPQFPGGYLRSTLAKEGVVAHMTPLLTAATRENSLLTGVVGPPARARRAPRHALRVLLEPDGHPRRLPEGMEFASCAAD